MRAIVLGAAAGGGFPQWNCGCANCVAVREGRPGYEPRTQDSIAVSNDGARFAVERGPRYTLADGVERLERGTGDQQRMPG